MKPTANCTIFDAKTFYEECTCGSPKNQDLESHRKNLLLDVIAVIWLLKKFKIDPLIPDLFVICSYGFHSAFTIKINAITLYFIFIYIHLSAD